jgi:hypothetical protein
MNRLFQGHLSRFFHRRLALALLKGFLLGLAVAVILTSLRMFHVEDARRFVAEHAGLFLAWRFLLYGGIAWGGWRVYRLRQAEFESDPEFRQRWRRTGIAVVSTFVLLEVSQLWQGA